jgi:hypothetical protein
VPTNSNFGIGILNGNNNLVEENTAIGNINGIIVGITATDTVIRSNVAMGNPPVQVSVGVPGSTGADIWDASVGRTTKYDRNVCATGINAPCDGLTNDTTPRKPGR